MTIQTYADLLACEQSAWQDRMPARNTYDLLCQACDRHAGKVALRFVPTGDPQGPAFDVDYRLLRARVTQAANAFGAAGITTGTAVTLLLPNLPETHYALLGAQAAGIASPINPMLDIDYIVSIVNETRAEALVAFAPSLNSDAWDKAVEVVDRCLGIRTMFVTGMRGYARKPVQDLLRDLYAKARRPQRGDVKIVEFDEAMNAQPADRLSSRRRIRESDICSYFHTGGTTGLPKVAMHSHLNETFVAWALSLLVPPQVMLGGLPLFHVNGAMVTGLAAFHGGWEVIMLTAAGYRGQDVMPNFWRLAERFRATSFSGVPTIFAALADLPLAGADLASLQFAFCGAAPLPSDVARRFEAAAGIPLVEGYGLTEGACVSAINPPRGDNRRGTVGLRLPYQQLKTWKVDGAGEAAAACAEGETGVVGVCGPNIFPGFLRDADNRGTWLKPGWLNTGDLGYLDGDGYLHLTGRAKDLIIRGGHNIDPAMIEESLARHPTVATAAAVGQPDAHAGELPVAYVTLRPGAAIAPDELLAAARELVPERAAVPVRIEIVKTMPLTAVGKIAKADLRLRAAEHVFSQILAQNSVNARVAIRTDVRRGAVTFVQCAEDEVERVHALLGGYAYAIEVSQTS
jgi:fatty-acyl-CoA synthase